MVKRNNSISCFVFILFLPFHIKSMMKEHLSGVVPFELTFCVFLTIDENVY